MTIKVSPKINNSSNLTSLSLIQGPPGESYGSEKGAPGEPGPQVNLDIECHVHLYHTVNTQVSLGGKCKMPNSNQFRFMYVF